MAASSAACLVERLQRLRHRRGVLLVEGRVAHRGLVLGHRGFQALDLRRQAVEFALQLVGELGGFS